jgi:thioredoxin reductase (NADPH)
VQIRDNAECIVVYGTSWCSDCKRAKQFLGARGIQYHWVDIEKDTEASALVERINAGKRIVPTIVFPDGSTLVEPSNAELAEKLSLISRAELAFYDVIIIGAGPAGLTAAIYTAREGFKTFVVEKDAPGGQAARTQVIDNYPGFDEGISGEEFARRLTRQAQRFDVEILEGVQVTDLCLDGRYRYVQTADGSTYAAAAILLAMGSHYRRLNVPGEEELIGKNIHFCATCDGAHYKDKEVLVVGGGNSGFEEGIFLTKYASRVRIVEIMPQVKASRILQDHVGGREEMEVVTDHAVREFLITEDGCFAGVEVQDNQTGGVEIWHPDGVFVYVGLSPNSDFLPAEIERDPFGFVITDAMLQTTVEGVFAAGDVRMGATSQAAAAAGEGATAAVMIRGYLEGK